MSGLVERSELQHLQAQLRQASVKVSTLQAENRKLRRMVQNSRGGHILHRARTDAEQILGWRFAGYSVSRRACEGYGMPRRRWIWAVGLLRKARIVADQVPALDDAFDVDLAPDDALRMLETAVKVVEAAGMVSLVMRVPRGHATLPRRAQ